MTTVRNFYIETYQDQFFIAPPSWFGLYLWFEVLYHVPLSLWAVGGLWRGMDPSAILCIFDYA